MNGVNGEPAILVVNGCDPAVIIAQPRELTQTKMSEKDPECNKATWRLSNRKDNLAERWGQLLDSGSWTDCSFLVGEANIEDSQQEVQCHSLVLASCSRVFGAMLMGPLAEKIFPVEIPDVTAAAFSDLVKFAYTERVSLRSVEQAVDLLCAADKYEMNDLVAACISFLGAKMQPEHVCAIFKVADQRQLQPLRQMCIRMLQDHTQEILALPSFREASKEMVGILLHQSQLNIVGENQLMIAVLNWAVAQTEQEGASSQTPPDIGCVPSLEPVTCKKGRVIEEEEEHRKNGVNKRKRDSITDTSEEVKHIDKKMCNGTKNEEALDACIPTRGLREILGNMVTQIRFLVPSVDFEGFLAKYPSVLSEEESRAIQLTREQFKKTEDEKKLWSNYGVAGCFVNIRNELEKQATIDNNAYQNGNPLPNSLCSKVDEREKATKCSYENDLGQKIPFKYASLREVKRQNHCYSREVTLYVTPNQEIVLHGIKVPSQILRTRSQNTDSSSTYNENISIKIQYHNNRSMLINGSIKFNDAVPYDSIIDIMFAKPVTFSETIILTVNFMTIGNYPALPSKDLTMAGEQIFIRFEKHSGDDNLIQGLLFDCRKVASCFLYIPETVNNIASDGESSVDREDEWDNASVEVEEDDSDEEDEEEGGEEIVSGEDDDGGDASDNDGGDNLEDDGGVASGDEGDASNDEGGDNLEDDGVESDNDGGVESDNDGGVESDNDGGVESDNDGGVASDNDGGDNLEDDGGVTSSDEAGDVIEDNGGVESDNDGGVESDNDGGVASDNDGGDNLEDDGGVTSSDEGGDVIEDNGGVESDNDGEVESDNDGGVESDIDRGGNLEDDRGVESDNDEEDGIDDDGGVTSSDEGRDDIEDDGGVSSSDEGGDDIEDDGGVSSSDEGGDASGDAGESESSDASDD